MLLLPGQKGTEILRVADGVVRLCYDTENSPDFGEHSWDVWIYASPTERMLMGV